MKRIVIAVFSAFIFIFGCSTSDLHIKNEKCNHIYAGFLPVNIEITSLSEMNYDVKDSRLKIYLSLKDSFASQKKAPGIVRFEIYQKVPRASEQKGKRILIWPDIDLTEPSENNKYWRDFLRCYEFVLKADMLEKKEYIMLVTFLLPDGKILFTEYVLRPK